MSGPELCVYYLSINEYKIKAFVSCLFSRTVNVCTPEI